MTELEKKAYDYVIERQKDPNYPVYNWETEITDAYEQGYKDAIDKAIEWLDNNLPLYWGEVNANNTDRFIRIFKKAMEEQQ